MEQKNKIQYRKLPGLTAQGVRVWALLFLLFGMALNPRVNDVLSSEGTNFWFTTVGLLLQLFHFCAIPLFVFLAVEGFTHTRSLKNYGIRMGILALVAQLPYSYAMYGELFSLKNFHMNPVFSMLLTMVLLYFFKRYSGKAPKRLLLKVLLWVMAFVWVNMLRIEYGVAVILLAPIMYFLRKKRTWMIFAGCIAMTLCGFLDAPGGDLSPRRAAAYIAAAPVSFMILHFYNGEPGEGNRYVNYLTYPVILIAISLFAKFAI
jgi:hypothetical protein